MSKNKRKLVEEEGKSEENSSDLPKKKISKHKTDIDKDSEEVIEKTEESKISTKRSAKEKAGDFDIKQFRKELRSKTCNTVGLTQFLHACAKSDQTVDYVLLYLKSGGNASEILKQLDEQNKKDPAIATPVFHVLHLILLKIQSSGLTQLLQGAEESCRYFLNSYVSTIEMMLNDKSVAKQQTITLKLLTAIVTLSPELGFTVLNQLSLQPKNLSHLVKHQNQKEKESTRNCFIHFLMAFFVDGNNPLIKTLLDKYALLTMIIPDLVKDTSETVLIVLNILKKHVINNLSISKTVKIRTFSQYVISNIFNLFNWKGHGSKSEVAGTDDIKMEVDEAVHDFLFTLCTSHKLGIYFTDKTLGTSDTPTSQFLWKALEFLEAPWNNEKAGRLIIQIVSNCPDLYKPVIHLVEDAFEPHNSERWLRTVNFLKSLLTSLPAQHVISVMSEMNSVQITTFVRNVYLPIPILKASVSTLASADNAIRNEIILLLQIMLSSVKAYLSILEVKDQKSHAVLKSRMEDFIPSHFPSTDALITVLHSILDDTSIASDPIEPESSSPILLLDKSILLINTLDLLLLYNEVLPNTLDPISTMLDSKRLFDKMEYLGESHKEELKLKITTFLLCADKFAFSPEKPLFKDILLSMFQVFTTKDTNLLKEAKGVLLDILESTGIFCNNKTEVDLLLIIIRSIGLTRNCNIAKEIVNVIENTIMHSNKFEMILNKHIQQSKRENKEVENNFDLLFENLEKYSKQLNAEYSVIKERTSLTHFIIGILEYTKGTSDENLKLLLNMFIFNILHYQENPDILWKILDSYEIDDDIHTYVVSWSTKPTRIDKSIVQESSTIFKLSKALLSNKDINKEKVFNLKEVHEITEGSRYINLDKQYMFFDEAVDISELFSWFQLVLFYITRESSLSLLTENNTANAAQAIQCILLLSKVDEEHPQKNLSMLLSSCLSHKCILQNFSPFEKNPEVSKSLLTNFVLDLILFCDKQNIESGLLSPLLAPYRHKVFSALMLHVKDSIASKKGPSLNTLDYVLSKIFLDHWDATTLVSEILKLNVSCMVSDENEASSWVRVVCLVINNCLKGSRVIPDNIVCKIAFLYSKIITELDLVINITDLEESLYNYLVANIEVIGKIPQSVFDATFAVKHVGKYTSKLSALLLRSNLKLLTKFSKNILNDNIISKRELVLPLTLAALRSSKFSSNDIIQKIFAHYSGNINKVIEKPQKATQIYIDNSELIVKLVYRCMTVTECESILKKVHKFDSTEVFHIDILEALFFKMVLGSGTININYFNNYLLCILQLAINVLKRDELIQDKLERLSSSIQILLLWCNDDVNFPINESETFTKLRENAIWQNFYKSILKYYLKTTLVAEPDQKNNVNLFGIVSSLIRLVYPDEHSEIEALFEMAASHSEFLNVMLSNRCVDVKTQLVKLLYTMVQKNKNVMKTSHIPVYLSAYHATRNACDLMLLGLLRLYESSGQSLSEYQPYLWGETAANHYALRSKRSKSSLWSNPTVNHLLNLLDKDMIEKTIKHYPMHAQLSPVVESHVLLGIGNNASVIKAMDDIIANVTYKNQGKTDDLLNTFNSKINILKNKLALVEMADENFCFNSVNTVEEADVYDPAFILPLLSFIVCPGSVVSCHRIVRGGIISIPLMALSSMCPLMRAAGYNVLHRFYQLLESEIYYKNDKLLWMQFVDTLKSSLGSAISVDKPEQRLLGGWNPRLSAIAAVYLARAALIMTHPLDPMFKPINNFIISKQYIDFLIVPDFLDLMHNTDVHFMERRIWMLEVLKDGIRTFSDIVIMLKSVAFKIVLDFYSSSLADNKVKLLLLKIVNTSICVPRAAKILTEGYGIMGWVSVSIRNLRSDNKQMISEAIKIVSNLWYSLVTETNSNISRDNKTEDIIKNILARSFKINDSQQCEILYLLMDLLKLLSSASLDDILIYLNVLRKISKSSLRFVSSAQMLSLVHQCDDIFDDSKDSKLLLTALENRKVNLVFTSQTIINDKNLTSKKTTAVIYLHEIIITWLT